MSAFLSAVPKFGLSAFLSAVPKFGLSAFLSAVPRFGLSVLSAVPKFGLSTVVLANEEAIVVNKIAAIKMVFFTMVYLSCLLLFVISI